MVTWGLAASPKTSLGWTATSWFQKVLEVARPRGQEPAYGPGGPTGGASSVAGGAANPGFHNSAVARGNSVFLADFESLNVWRQKAQLQAILKSAYV